MKIRSYILIIIINCIVVFNCLAENKEFENFARHQSQLMNQASSNKDVVAYGHLLDALKIKYDKLSAKDKKDYAAYLAEGYYNYSCEYSILNNKSLAISFLQKAIKAGYNNYKHVIEDSDLDNLRNEPSFIALVQPLREVGDYIYILKKGGTYNAADNRPLPAFTYQSADDPSLVMLRKTLNLDSIAGTGNDISKVFNLMNWIHNLIPHDGNHENPAVKNALSMINVCRQEKRGLNCRGLATVLNECYLAMDIRSRLVTCLPKDSLKMDNDCHVINMVYINSLKKWVWIDPTFAAYVMNEYGQLLGISEVRERIIDGRPLMLNREANWNHRHYQTKENYLYNYMAKNLYRLQCLTGSEYDAETTTPDKTITYVQLLPLDYFNQEPDRLESLNPDKVTYVQYNTDNPALFWAAPDK